MKQLTPEEALRRANQAKAILDQPIVTETLDLMESEIMEAWMACPVRDVEGRETLWRIAVSTRKFRDILRGTMEAGKLAKDQIERKQTAMQRVANIAQNFRR